MVKRQLSTADKVISVLTQELVRVPDIAALAGVPMVDVFALCGDERIHFEDIQTIRGRGQIIAMRLA